MGSGAVVEAPAGVETSGVEGAGVAADMVHGKLRPPVEVLTLKPCGLSQAKAFSRRVPRDYVYAQRSAAASRRYSEARAAATAKVSTKFRDTFVTLESGILMQRT